MELLRLEDPFEVRIIERINRFVVLVKRGNTLLRAHNTNTGRLKEFLVEGKRAFCLPKRGGKTDCRLFAVEDIFGFAVIDTSLQMRAFEEAFRKGFLNWLHPNEWKLLKRNVPLGEHSLIDYLFEGRKGKRLYLEVKSAAMRSPEGFGMYPDCPTERGRKQLRELIEIPDRSAVLFICALPGVRGFKPHCGGDPQICSLLREAKNRGVLLKAISMHFVPSKGAIVLENSDLPVVL